MARVVDDQQAIIFVFFVDEICEALLEQYLR